MLLGMIGVNFVETMSFPEYLTYNAIGLIPGPNEDEVAFNRRAKHCLSLKKGFADCFFCDNKKQQANRPIPNEVLQLTQYYYGIQPAWVPVIYSDEKLALWHGGAAWIFQMEDASPTAAFLQLRSVFAYKNDYLRLLSKSELMTHELSHVGRMMFNEPKFEEMLAYQSSSSWLARNLGPLVQSPMESLVFVIVLMVLICLDSMAIFLNYSYLYQLALWFKLIPLTMVGGAILRLAIKKNQLKKCYQQLYVLCDSRQKARSILYRLTDSEITYFASASLSTVQDYIQSNNELRWQVIKKAYHL